MPVPGRSDRLLSLRSSKPKRAWHCLLGAFSFDEMFFANREEKPANVTGFLPPALARVI
jgi:hypothetical protein